MGNLLDIDPIMTSTVTARKLPRIRVEIDTIKPIPDGFSLPKIYRSQAKISFKYERLSEFCYLCGCLGHVHQACPINMGTVVELPYEQWLWANGHEQRRNVRPEDSMWILAKPDPQAHEHPTPLPPIRIQELLHKILCPETLIAAGESTHTQAILKGKGKMLFEPNAEKIRLHPQLLKGSNSSNANEDTVHIFPEEQPCKVTDSPCIALCPCGDIQR